MLTSAHKAPDSARSPNPSRSSAAACAPHFVCPPRRQLYHQDVFKHARALRSLVCPNWRVLECFWCTSPAHGRKGSRSLAIVQFVACVWWRSRRANRDPVVPPTRPVATIAGPVVTLMIAGSSGASMPVLTMPSLCKAPAA